MQKNEVLVILHDITEEREMQERLYQTDRLASLGEMAAGIAHELNNPLTGVVALSQLIVDTHEQSSWYFITQASLALNPGALDARRTSVSSPFPPQLWRQNTLATKPHSLSNTAVLTNRTFSLIHYLYAASF